MQFLHDLTLIHLPALSLVPAALWIIQEMIVVKRKGECFTRLMMLDLDGGPERRVETHPQWFLGQKKKKKKRLWGWNCFSNKSGPAPPLWSSRYSTPPPPPSAICHPWLCPSIDNAFDWTAAKWVKQPTHVFSCHPHPGTAGGGGASQVMRCGGAALA